MLHVVLTFEHFKFVRRESLRNWWHLGRPKHGHRRRSTTVFHRPLGFEDEFIELLGITCIAEELLGDGDRIQEFLKQLSSCILHIGKIDYNLLPSLLNVVGGQLPRCILEHLERQLVHGKLVDVENDNPLFDLTGNQHISVDVAGVEVVQ